jgi:hypothetical protein
VWPWDRDHEKDSDAGKYDAVYARKLVHQPTAEAIKAIQNFASQVVSAFAAALAEDDPLQCPAGVRHARSMSQSQHCTHSDEEVCRSCTFSCIVWQARSIDMCGSIV